MTKLHTLLKMSLLAGLIAMLTGCGEGLGDLRQYVQQIRAKPPGRIEPIPEFTPYQNFEYTSHDLRDPFKLVDFRRPDEIEPDTAILGDGLRPDLDRVHRRQGRDQVGPDFCSGQHHTPCTRR
jgi:type IV pilus assembly protein PilP